MGGIHGHIWCISGTPFNRHCLSSRSGFNIIAKEPLIFVFIKYVLHVSYHTLNSFITLRHQPRGPIYTYINRQSGMWTPSLIKLLAVQTSVFGCSFFCVSTNIWFLGWVYWSKVTPYEMTTYIRYGKCIHKCWHDELLMLLATENKCHNQKRLGIFSYKTFRPRSLHLKNKHFWDNYLKQTYQVSIADNDGRVL